jgi:hypothetical protein
VSFGQRLGQEASVAFELLVASSGVTHRGVGDGFQHEKSGITVEEL